VFSERTGYNNRMVLDACPPFQILERQARHKLVTPTWIERYNQRVKGDLQETAIAEQPVMLKQEGKILIEDDETRVSKIAVRISPFWPEEPELWFTQLEGQFVLYDE